MTPREILDTLNWVKPYNPMYEEQSYYIPKSDFEEVAIQYIIEQLNSSKYQIKTNKYGKIIFCKY